MGVYRSERVMLVGAAGARVAAPIVYDYLLTVSAGTYTATRPNGTVVSSSSTLRTVIDAIKGAGVKIQFAGGIFDYGADHTTYNDLDGIQFWGSGIDVTLVSNSQNDAADTEPFSFTRCDGVVIRDMTVVAGGTARGSSDAIDNDGGSNWLIERVKITASRARGIVFDGKDPGAVCDGGMIRYCQISGTQGATAGHGITLLGTTNTTIEYCTITSPVSHGINITKGSTATGVKATNNIVRNNTVVLAGRDGINIVSCDNNQIRNNSVTNSATLTASRDGIRIETADGVAANTNTIDGNTCSDDRTPKRQRYGINVGPATAAEANNNVVTNNDLRGNLTGALNDTGTGTVKSGNILA